MVAPSSRSSALNKSKSTKLPPEEGHSGEVKPQPTYFNGHLLCLLMILVASAFCFACIWGLIPAYLQSKTISPKEGWRGADGRGGAILDKPNPMTCMAVPESYRFDCYPGESSSQISCEARGCCWASPAPPRKRDPLQNIPFCFYPANYRPHQLLNITHHDYGLIAVYKRLLASGYPNDSDFLTLELTSHKDKTIRIKVSDQSRRAFEVPDVHPMPEQAVQPSAQEYRDLDVELSPDALGFKVSKKSTKQVLFDSIDVGGLVFSDQFLQISTLLPSNYIYGLGEQHERFLKSTEWSDYVLWNGDEAPAPKTNLYGSHPFYMALDELGQAHGVFFKNSHAMEVVLQPSPALTFRALGGVLDIRLIPGPTPVRVIERYASVIGKPFLPPYWSLGYHQCRWGYKTLNRTREVLEQTIKAGIPIDVQWNDIEYMERRNDFTYDKNAYGGLPDFIRDLHNGGMKYVQIFDPGVSGSEEPGTYPPYDKGIEMDVFIKNSSDQVFVGKVWNDKSTVWPDFTHPTTLRYWNDLFAEYHKTLPIDGVWIDMNEPSNFYDGQIDGCSKSDDPDYNLDNPFYVPAGIAGGTLYHKTICPSAKQALGNHYELHNLHGLFESMATATVMMEIRKKRPFVLSRSTFPGQGHYGAHWTGDVASSWEDMRVSISQILNFNMFGIPLVGADICGFRGNTTVTLCKRWMQLGAFYPFSRNHNTLGTIAQDPVSLGPEVVVASRKALNARYRLLPFLYTLMVDAHLRGTPVARALMFNYPKDRKTYDLDSQFMWGNDLLIIPIITEEYLGGFIGYFPSGTWYDYYNSLAAITSEGEFLNVQTASDDIPLFFRGGAVVPLQRNGSTTTESRKNPFFLRVFFDQTCPNKTGGDSCRRQQRNAKGKLYVDDGESIDTYDVGKFLLVKFEARDVKGKNGALSSRVQNSNFTLPSGQKAILEHVGVHGISDVQKVKTVMINGQPTKFYTDAGVGMLGIPNLGHDLSQAFELRWMF